MGTLGLSELVLQAGYPSTSAITAWQSIGTLLLAKCARRHRAHHIDALTDDAGLAFGLQLSALPKATHAGSYSYRVRRESNTKLLTGLVKALRPLGMASGTAGFNLDFHAIRHHGEHTALEKHYLPRRSQRTRAVLTFFAQDHASTEMVYANAEITKAEQAREIIAFADYWRQATGEDPGLLVFDSQLTTDKVLDELTARGIRWLTLRQRGSTELARLGALPAGKWKTTTIARSGRYRRPQLHEESMIKLKDVDTKVRQLAIRNIGRDEPTLLITNDLTTPGRDLFARYAERMSIETNSTPTSPASTSTRSPAPSRSTSTSTPRSPSSPTPLPPLRPRPDPIPDRHPRHHLAPLPRRPRHPAHQRPRRHLRAEPTQPPPTAHRRRLRRPQNPNPMVGQPNSPIHLPTQITAHPARTTSTQFPHRESRLTAILRYQFGVVVEQPQ